MTTATFNTKELEDYVKKLEKVVQDEDKIMTKVVFDLALNTLTDIEFNTPVDTGTLRMGWFVDTQEEAEKNAMGDSPIPQEVIENSIKVTRKGKTYSTQIANVVNYAYWVENGRKRRRKGKVIGFIDGFHMLENAKVKLERLGPKIIKESLETQLKEYGL